ncbi:cell division protein FtsQ/DivIB [Sphaerisporangium aureirubrum]|uniref:Cell division protein FtsQ/DivIB n=1 Tax=Sphaerisporangium aureirubrum TaxID=1544736 RepID=A0ABW1NV54_9ACTN
MSAPWRTGLAVLLFCAVVAAAAWLVFFSPVLGVRKVAVSGNHGLSAEEVRRAAAVPPQQPLAAVDVEGVRRRVAALRQVESVTVERAWPSTLRIRLDERVPLAALPVPGGAAVVDRHAVVIETREATPVGLPVLRVGSFGPDDPATTAALAVVRGLPWELSRRVQEVRATTGRDVSLRLADGRTIMWGDAERTRDKARVAIALLERPGDAYDVSTPDVVTVK